MNGQSDWTYKMAKIKKRGGVRSRVAQFRNWSCVTVKVDASDSLENRSNEVKNELNFDKVIFIFSAITFQYT